MTSVTSAIDALPGIHPDNSCLHMPSPHYYRSNTNEKRFCLYPYGLYEQGNKKFLDDVTEAMAPALLSSC